MRPNTEQTGAPMIRILTFAAGLAAAVPAAAFDVGDMTDAERKAFREEIRAYLLDNPEVLMEAIAVLEDREEAERAEADADLVAAHADALFDDGVSWVGGNPDGDVTIVEFLDYRCSYCRRAHPEIAELLAQDSDIRLIVKEFPILGEDSLMASRFAIAVHRLGGDAAYEAVHDMLITQRGGVTQDCGRLGREVLSVPEMARSGMDDKGRWRIRRSPRSSGRTGRSGSRSGSPARRPS